ncbi:MAG: hypothetical protein RI601_02680 [Desulfurivibrionaceae bacterium]|nr:hypothetical protein [Desulfurivibrionaceae bacterium]
MAVSGIPTSYSIPPSTLSRRERAPVQPPPPLPEAEEQAAAPALSTEDALQDNEQLINEILRSLLFPPAEPTDIGIFDTRSPLLTVLEETEELSPLQQSALLVSDILRNLGVTPAEPTSPLLIDIMPADLEAAEITEDLSPIQQNLYYVNETLLDLGFRPPLGQLRLPPGPFPVTMAAQEEIIPAMAAAGATAAPPILALTLARQEPVSITPVTLPAAAPPGAVPTSEAGEEAGLTARGIFMSQEITPATLPISLFPERIPYVFAVYIIDNPTPAPSLMGEPIDVDLPPPTAITKTRAVGQARLRQAHFRERGGEQSGNIEYNEPPFTAGQVEKSIRHSLDLMNRELAAQNKPFHLVFARHDNDFGLDLYDCAASDACWKRYEIPIPLDNMAEMLIKMEHKTGIIIDTDS